jgi:tetratricopeptide (TPR) repeat protein
MTDDTAYFESKEFLNILNKYETSVKSEHAIYMDADDLADIADYYHYNGRDEEANEAIELALTYNPEAVGPLLYKAREALSRGDYEDAEDYASRIEAVDSQEAVYLKGEIMISQGKVDEANDYFRQKMDEIMPDELTDYVYDVANVFSDYNIHNIAFEWIARSQGDDSDDFKELMGHTLFGLGKYKDSERIFNELIDHDPYSARYWNALANAQFMSEDYNASITSSEYAIAIDPHDAESILAKANGLFSLNNYESALTYYRRYSDIMEDDYFGYLHQGTCLLNLGHPEEAIVALEKAEQTATAAGPQIHADIYQELAFAYGDLHKLDQALYYIDKAEELGCDHANMEVIRGHILLSSNQQKEAELAFKKALKLSDNTPKTMLRIVVSLYDNQYPLTCYTLFKKFFKHIYSDWNDGYSYMALCCLDLKKYDEFLYYLDLAVKRNPKEAGAVLGGLFPEGTLPEEYVAYMLNQTNKEST